MTEPPDPLIDVVPLQGWLKRHNVPYLHGCVWDRWCRWEGCPPRLSLIWGDRMWWFDLDDWAGGVHHIHR